MPTLQNIAQTARGGQPSGLGVLPQLSQFFAQQKQAALQNMELKLKEKQKDLSEKAKVIKAIGTLLGTGAGAALQTGGSVERGAQIGGAFGGGDFARGQQALGEVAKIREMGQAKQGPAGTIPPHIAIAAQLLGINPQTLAGVSGQRQQAPGQTLARQPVVPGAQIQPQPGQVQPVVGGGFRPESITIGKAGPTTTLKRVPTAAEKQEELAGIKTKKEVAELVKRRVERQKIETNFNTSISLFKGLVGQLKGRAQEQGGFGLGPAFLGDVKVLTKRLGVKTGPTGRITATAGQQRETALTLNRILTGQNRVIKGVVQMINETLPTKHDTQDQIAGKVAQSIRNAFGITKAFEKTGLTPDVISKMSQNELNSINPRRLMQQFTLTPQEQQRLESIIQDVLTTPAIRPRTLEGNGNQATTRSGIGFTFKEIK